MLIQFHLTSSAVYTLPTFVVRDIVITEENQERCRRFRCSDINVNDNGSTRQWNVLNLLLTLKNPHF